MTQQPGSWPDGSPSPGSVPSYPDSVAYPAEPPSGPDAGAAPHSDPTPALLFHRTPASGADAAAGSAPPGVPSGPVSPWARPGHLPAVEPVPALPTPPSPLADGPRPAGHPVAPLSGGPIGAAAVAVAPPPREGRWKPVRVDVVQGTDFGVVQLEVAPVTSGMAIGSLLAGIAAVGVSFVVLCLGVIGVQDGWGAWVAGAFTMLGLVAGGGGLGLGLTALRQIRRSGQPGLIRFTGRGTALTGAWCGGAGAGICLLSLALVVVLQVA